ncbi:flavin reductase family protein [Rubellimicrobium rubrum]|uniref:Flavin reductase family protein n=1 Tax=Rubellimicrobium rubrum TaxID=2585369 RepID=A0A5C4MU47_9RHOB|nr:flavin reductase family protein [Rubellimicrobium rubrum]TNC47886.1 flavin reductase family protein [Rubellimicrobium rubrum]
MFYRPADGHGLRHNPFHAVVSPRPIAWISTRGLDGVDNLAPYSFFNAMASEPPQVVFGSSETKPDRDGTKDSLGNIRDTGVFCINIVEFAAREAMNASSAPHPREVDEFGAAGIAKASCETIPCVRVAGAPAALECRLTRIVRLAGDANYAVFGVVTGVHLRDDCLVDGRLDVTRYHPLSRLGYRDYAVVQEVFQMARPRAIPTR